RVAVPELVAEALPAARPLQPMDALIAVVVEEQHGDLKPLLLRRNQLAAQHQVAAIADERVNLPLGISHLHPERAGHLVAHARIRVLRVIVALSPALPELLEVTGEAPSGVHDRSALARLLVDDPNDARLLQRTVTLRRRSDDVGVVLLPPGFRCPQLTR